MPSLPASAESVRAVNAKIGQNYDTLPYDAHPNPELDPERVLGLAALYGCAADAGAAHPVVGSADLASSLSGLMLSAAFTSATAGPC
jgi:hypothetical protein